MQANTTMSHLVCLRRCRPSTESHSQSHAHHRKPQLDCHYRLRLRRYNTLNNTLSFSSSLSFSLYFSKRLPNKSCTFWFSLQNSSAQQTTGALTVHSLPSSFCSSSPSSFDFFFLSLFLSLSPHSCPKGPRTPPSFSSNEFALILGIALPHLLAKAVPHHFSPSIGQQVNICLTRGHSRQSRTHKTSASIRIR